MLILGALLTVTWYILMIIFDLLIFTCMVLYAFAIVLIYIGLNSLYPRDHIKNCYKAFAWPLLRKPEINKILEASKETIFYRD